MSNFLTKVKKLLVIPTAVFICGTGTVAFADDTTYYTSANVNLRTFDSLDAEIIKVVSLGSEITVTEFNPEGWSQVLVNGETGFMKSEFITEEQYIEQENGLVEHTPWSEAKQIFTIGVPAKVYDVRTGLVYYVKSFSNGLHADVEPITTEDTAIMKRTFNGVWSWDVRPVWVTINGRTMAASINGMPHGGGVNSNNGMNGQVCIHFKGSTTHNGNKSFAALHQQVALEAYNASK